MATQYQYPSSFMAAIGFYLDSTEFVLGLANEVVWAAPDEHVIYPYGTTSTSYSTASTLAPSVGTLSFNGLLLANASGLKTTLFDYFGEFITSMEVKLSEKATSTVMINKTLYDVRLKTIGMGAVVFANTLIAKGSFKFTFRRMEDVVVP